MPLLLIRNLKAIMILKDIEFHDLPILKVNFDFVNAALELEVDVEINPDSSDFILKKIIFESVTGFKSDGFPQLQSDPEIYSLDIKQGATLKHAVKMVVLTGFGQPSWSCEFECSAIQL